MKVRRLDEKHDWTFGNGLRSYARDSKSVAQNVKTALLSLYSDWFLDSEHGVRWFNYLRKNPDISAMEGELKSAILNVDGVVKLMEFEISLDVNTRLCTVFVAYLDIFGEENEVSADAPGY